MKPLVIYESPNKYNLFRDLFSDRDVGFCYTQGRIFDLPNDSLGLDNKLNPELVAISPKRESVITSKINSHSEVLCLTDNDAEGEWIAQHIKDIATSCGKKFWRVRTNALTKDDLNSAIKKASSEIDIGLMTKAASRRLLDRVIGFYQNEDKMLTRGRILTPAISAIHQQPTLPTHALLYSKEGTQVLFEGKAEDIHTLKSSLESASESVITDSTSQTVGLYNTMDYLKERSLLSGKDPCDSFSELQQMYEQGLVSYTRTYNQAYEVMNGEHSGISALDLDADEDSSSEGFSMILTRTLLHRKPERFKISVPTLSNPILRVCRDNNINVISAHTIHEVSDSHHSMPKPVYLFKGTSIPRRGAEIKVLAFNQDFQLLRLLDSMELGQPSTFHSHIKKLREFTNFENSQLRLNLKGMRIALQTDSLSLLLTTPKITRSLEELLDNNTLSIEQKKQKCLNILRITPSDDGTFVLNNQGF